MYDHDLWLAGCADDSCSNPEPETEKEPEEVLEGYAEKMLEVYCAAVSSANCPHKCSICIHHIISKITEDLAEA